MIHIILSEINIYNISLITVILLIGWAFGYKTGSTSVKKAYDGKTIPLPSSDISPRD